MALCYNNIGQVFCNQGRHDEAVDMHYRSLAIRLKAHDPEHPDVAQSYHNLGLDHHHKKEENKAREMFEKALVIRVSKLGVDHPDTKCTREWMEKVQI